MHDARWVNEVGWTHDARAFTSPYSCGYAELSSDQRSSIHVRKRDAWTDLGSESFPQAPTCAARCKSAAPLGGTRTQTPGWEWCRLSGKHTHTHEKEWHVTMVTKVSTTNSLTNNSTTLQRITDEALHRGIIVKATNCGLIWDASPVPWATDSHRPSHWDANAGNTHTPIHTHSYTHKHTHTHQ